MDQPAFFLTVFITAVILELLLLNHWQRLRSEPEGEMDTPSSQRELNSSGPERLQDTEPVSSEAVIRVEPADKPEAKPGPSDQPEDPVQVDLTLKMTRGSRVQITIDLPDFTWEEEDSFPEGPEIALTAQQPEVEGSYRWTAPASSPLRQRVRNWLPKLQVPDWMTKIQGKFQAWGLLQSIQAPLIHEGTAAEGITLAAGLFAGALILYSLTRIIGLTSFPIYFFTDEAVQTVLAEDFIRDGFRGYQGRLFPTYFQNASFFNLSISVYLQVIPHLIFDRSIFLTRFTSVLVTIFGAAGMGLILRDQFRLRHWWLGSLLLSITPAWFLHSRTAFETVLCVSFYVWFIYFYLDYRNGMDKSLYKALLFGGLVFYSYSPGQIIIVSTGLLLLISDAAYHWRHRSTALRGVGLLVLLALPYLRFQIHHEGQTYFHLRMLNSYWLMDLSVPEKLQQFLDLYLRGLSPGYWYFPHQEDLIRHVMKGYGHILPYTLPFAAIGFGYSLLNIKESRFRVITIALLISPIAMAMVGIGLTRMLVYVVPAALITSFGLELCSRWLGRLVPQRAFALGTFGILSIVNGYMLWDSLENGPTWFQDYGLYGMQYGAEQVFGEIEATLETASPGTEVYLSPVWANGADILLRYFFPDLVPVYLLNVDGLLYNRVENLERKVFVLTPEEYAKVADSPKFQEIEVLKTIPYPDGRPGFYFMQLEYAPDIETILQEELEQRLEPVTESLRISGRSVQVTHPPFDAGRLEDIFDGDLFTLARSRQANPAVLDFQFQTPLRVSGLTITTGSMNLRLKVRLFVGEAADPISFTWNFPDLPPDPTVDVEFREGPYQITRIEVSVQNLNEGKDAKVHIREIEFHVEEGG